MQCLATEERGNRRTVGCDTWNVMKTHKYYERKIACTRYYKCFFFFFFIVKHEMKLMRFIYTFEDYAQLFINFAVRAAIRYFSSKCAFYLFKNKT